MNSIIDEVQNNNVVTKANLLIEANYKLTLTEQKIVLFLVSKIRKDDQDFQVYQLPIKKFCELIGLKGTPKYTELRKITKELMGKVMEIKEGKKTKQLSWISYVEYDEDEGSVLVSFDPRLKPYLLELKKEFTSYRLKNVMSLKSGYSIRVYEILKKWENVKNITISLKELRSMAGVGDKYKEYHNFKKRVLTPAQKELKERTDIAFDFIEVKEGRKVNKIKFRIYTQRIKPEQLSILEEETLVNKINQLTSKKGYNVDLKTVERWEGLAKERWSDEYGNNLLFLIDEVNHDKDIQNPIGYITWCLKESNEQESKFNRKVIRQEKVPEWLKNNKLAKEVDYDPPNNSQETKDEWDKEKFEELIRRFK